MAWPAVWVIARLFYSNHVGSASVSGSVTTALLRTFDPTAVLVLNLCGTFVFGISGGLAGVRARLDRSA